jgi:hypothetical protein
MSRRSGLRLVLFPLLLAACGAENSATDAQPPLPAPDSGVVPPSAWAQPPAPACPQATTGVGEVWLDDPDDMSLVERPLYCLSGTGQLKGTFVSDIAPDSWQPAQEDDDHFVYTMGDAHLHEVQAYYAVMGMVGTYQALMSTGEPSPIQIEIGERKSFAQSHYYLPDLLIVGLKGVKPDMVPIQILCHEYGHHLIMSRVPKIEQLLNEALADYLAAAFTGNPRILSLDRLDVPQAVLDDPQALAIAARYLERTVDNDLTYPDDVVTNEKLCQTIQQAADTFPPDTELVPESRLAECKSLSPQELTEPEPHRTGAILAGALWQLREQLGAAVVNELIFDALAVQKPAALSFLTFDDALVEADRARHDGAHVAAIRQVFDARGL